MSIVNTMSNVYNSHTDPTQWPLLTPNQVTFNHAQDLLVKGDKNSVHKALEKLNELLLDSKTDTQMKNKIHFILGEANLYGIADQRVDHQKALKIFQNISENSEEHTLDRKLSNFYISYLKIDTSSKEAINHYDTLLQTIDDTFPEKCKHLILLGKVQTYIKFKDYPPAKQTCKDLIHSHHNQSLFSEILLIKTKFLYANLLHTVNNLQNSAEIQTLCGEICKNPRTPSFEYNYSKFYLTLSDEKKASSFKDFSAVCEAYKEINDCENLDVELRNETLTHFFFTLEKLRFLVQSPNDYQKTVSIFEVLLQLVNNIKDEKKKLTVELTQAKFFVRNMGFASNSHDLKKAYAFFLNLVQMPLGIPQETISQSYLYLGHLSSRGFLDHISLKQGADYYKSAIESAKKNDHVYWEGTLGLARILHYGDEQFASDVKNSMDLCHEIIASANDPHHSYQAKMLLLDLMLSYDNPLINLSEAQAFCHELLKYNSISHEDRFTIKCYLLYMQSFEKTKDSTLRETSLELLKIFQQVDLPVNYRAKAGILWYKIYLSPSLSTIPSIKLIYLDEILNFKNLSPYLFMETQYIKTLDPTTTEEDRLTISSLIIKSPYSKGHVKTLCKKRLAQSLIGKNDNESRRLLKELLIDPNLDQENKKRIKLELLKILENPQSYSEMLTLYDQMIVDTEQETEKNHAKMEKLLFLIKQKKNNILADEEIINVCNDLMNSSQLSSQDQAFVKLHLGEIISEGYFTETRKIHANPLIGLKFLKQIVESVDAPQEIKAKAHFGIANVQCNLSATSEEGLSHLYQAFYIGNTPMKTACKHTIKALIDFNPQSSILLYVLTLFCEGEILEWSKQLPLPLDLFLNHLLSQDIPNKESKTRLISHLIDSHNLKSIPQGQKALDTFSLYCLDIAQSSFASTPLLALKVLTNISKDSILYPEALSLSINLNYKFTLSSSEQFKKYNAFKAIKPLIKKAEKYFKKYEFNYVKAPINPEYLAHLKATLEIAQQDWSVDYYAEKAVLIERNKKRKYPEDSSDLGLITTKKRKLIH